MSDAGRDAFKLAFELSPIFLTGGLASLIPFNMLPIMVLTEAVNFTAGLLSGPQNLSLDNAFAHFKVLPGGTLVDNAVGSYPFANQAVAANAIISQPLAVSMEMVCPARGPAGFAVKLATIMALKASLDIHNNSGGTYTVVTPSYFYTNCIMVGMQDIGGGDGHQVQTRFRMDFRQPLLTLQQAQQALNGLMGKLAAGLPTDGALFGAGGVTNPFSLPGAGAVIPSANVAGGVVSGSIPSA